MYAINIWLKTEFKCLFWHKWTYPKITLMTLRNASFTCRVSSTFLSYIIMLIKLYPLGLCMILRRVLSSGIKRRVVLWKSTDVSEVHVASIFRKEEYALEETNMKQAASQDSHFRILDCVQGKEILINGSWNKIRKFSAWYYNRCYTMISNAETYQNFSLFID
jgi:hypothetical protein